MTREEQVKYSQPVVNYSEGEFIASFEEFGLSVTGHGETEEEAIVDLYKALRALDRVEARKK